MSKHEIRRSVLLAVMVLAGVAPNARAQIAPARITGLCPPATTVGDPALRIVIAGTNLPQVTAVYWADRTTGVTVPLPTLPVSAAAGTSISVDVPQIIVQHDSDIWVTLPVAANAVSSFPAVVIPPVTFRVYPAPVIESLRPAATTAGVPLSLVVRGATFMPAQAPCGAGTELLWNGQPLQTVSVDTVGSISASVPASLLTPGRAQISVRNRGNGLSAPVELIINRPPSITTTLPDATTGRSYNVPFEGLDGTAPYVWSVVPGFGDLPPGLLLSSAGVLSGLPSQTGSYSFRVRLRDGASAEAIRGYTLQVFQPDFKPTIRSLCPGATTQGDQGLVLTLSVPGSFRPGVYWDGVPLELVVSNTPGAGGMSLSARVDSRLTGVAGGHSISVANLDTRAATRSDAMPFQVMARPSIASLTPAAVTAATTAGVPLSLVVRGATFMPAQAPCGAGTELLWNGQPLQTVSVDTVGSISASVPASLLTPGRAQISVRNRGNGLSAPVELIINRPPSITTTLPDATTGRSYSVPFEGIDGTAPYVWSVVPGFGDLPPGLLLSSAGVLSGLPSQTGSYSFRVRLRDDASSEATRDYTLQVFQPDLKPTIQSLCPGATTQGDQGLVLNLAVAGSFRPRVYWDGAPLELVASNAPPGTGAMTLSARVDAKLTGIAGRHNISVANLDTQAATPSDAMPFQVMPRPSIASITPDAVTEGATLRVQVTGTNFVAPGSNCGTSSVLEWNGQPLTSGVVVSDSGITADIQSGLVTAGQATIVIANPGGGRSNTAGLTINPPPRILTSNLPMALAGRQYPSTVLLATGGTPPLVWNLVGGAGLSIDSATGTVTGTPNSEGDFDVAAQVLDRSSVKASQTLRVRILPTLRMSIAGLPETIPASAQGASQPRFQVQVDLPGGYPADIHGNLTLTFEPDPDLRNAGVVDPERQLSMGPAFTLPAFALGLPVQLQPGTSAGKITATATSLNAGGIDITPTPPPSATIRVPAGPPVFTACVEERTASSLRLRMDGTSTTHEVRRAVFRFASPAGTSLQTTELPADDIGSRLFDPFYASQAGYFRFVQSFQIQGDISAIGGVSVILENAKGTSPAVAAASVCPVQ